jgi:hypothetical protein
METALLGDSMDLKQLAYAEVDCSQIAGTVDVKISYRGSKGTYQPILSTRILAATEGYEYETSYASNDINKLGFLQTQHRRLITESVQPNSAEKSCESNFLLNIDKAFSLLIEWCGGLGVDALRMYQDPFQDRSTGQVTLDETQFCVLGETGATTLVSLDPAPQENPNSQRMVWTATKTASVQVGSIPGRYGNAVATATATATSYISQADADAIALAKATAEAQLAAQQYRALNPPIT